MRRGFDFEAQVDKVVEYVNNIGAHAHKNNPKRTLDGIFLEGEPFDYEIFLKDYKAVFDAKKADTKVWHMLKKDIIQAEKLKHCKNTGLKAYFLVCFENKYVRQIDIDKVIDVLKQGSKSIPIELGCEWELLKILKSGDI